MSTLGTPTLIDSLVLIGVITVFLSNAEQVGDAVIPTTAIVVHVGIEAVLSGEVGQPFGQADVEFQRRCLLLMEHGTSARIPGRRCNKTPCRARLRPRQVFRRGPRLPGTAVGCGQVHAGDDIRIHPPAPEDIDGSDQAAAPLLIAERFGLAGADPVEFLLVEDFQVGRVAQQARLLVDSFQLPFREGRSDQLTGKTPRAEVGPDGLQGLDVDLHLFLERMVGPGDRAAADAGR